MQPLPTSTAHIHYYNLNPNGNTYVCGDIHGCYDELLVALDAINFDFDHDILFSLGDIVDRGTDDYAAMSLQTQPWFRQIIGNHEALHLEEYLTHPSNGTGWAVIHYYDNDPDYLAFKQRCRQLPHAIIIDNRYVLIHAALPMISYSGLAEVVDIKQTLHEYNFYTDLFRPDPTLWDIHYLHTPQVAELPGIDYVFYGHYIQPKVTIKDKSVYLDTGFMSPVFSRKAVNCISFALLNDKPTYLTVSVDFDQHQVVNVAVNDVLTINLTEPSNDYHARTNQAEA